jgi:hypothetical protein
MSYVASRLQTEGKWKRISTSGDGRNLGSSWAFTGHDRQPWTGNVAIEPIKSDSADYRIVFAIARKSSESLPHRGD